MPQFLIVLYYLKPFILNLWIKFHNTNNTDPTNKGMWKIQSLNSRCRRLIFIHKTDTYSSNFTAHKHSYRIFLETGDAAAAHNNRARIRPQTRRLPFLNKKRRDAIVKRKPHGAIIEQETRHMSWSGYRICRPLHTEHTKPGNLLDRGARNKRSLWYYFHPSLGWSLLSQ